MDWKLFQAAASGDTDFLRQTEAHKLNSEVTPQKNTVLHIVVKSKQKEFAKQILGRCPSLLRKANIKGDTPLHVAARIGCFELAEIFIDTEKTQHEDVESQKFNVLRMVNLEKKETALHVAVRNGHLGVVKLLMEADLGLLDLVNNAGESPLYLAVVGGFIDIIHHILETSPSSPCGGTNGTTALHAAVFQKRHGIMKILVEKRRDMIKEADTSKRTPLPYAALSDDLRAVQLFLKYDSSAGYLFDEDETSPFQLAAYEGHVDVVRELIQWCPYIWELLDKKGQTALHVAVMAGKEKIVKYILEAPELVGLINEPDKEGNTPLHLAVVYEKYTIISILARDDRVDKHALNNKFYTAMDIFNSKKRKIFFAVAKVRYLLRDTEGQPSFQRRVTAIEGAEKGKSVSESRRSMFDVHLLVATLIATVTFPAAFTMPGGYKSDGSPDHGIANFIERAAFKAFVVFDTTGFGFSAATVYLLFYASTHGYYENPTFINLALFFIFMANVGMALAFVTGMYIVLAKSIGLAITAYLMAACFMLAFFVYWFFDPRGYHVPGLDRPRIYFRNLLFDHGII